MKNNMKKIIVAGLSFVFLFIGTQSVFAASPFNGQSGDCTPGIGIGNYSNNNIPRDNNGCWTSTSISADAGDTINVAMYYHNNTNSTLSNVRGSIVKSSSGPASYYTFTGRMFSDQGDQTIGTVSLNLSSSQTLTYSSTHIMRTASDVLADRDTSVVYNDDGQVQIGSVPSGWSDYGEILVVFKVGSDNSNYNNNNNSSCSISSFTVNGYSSSSSVSSGDQVRVYWSTNNCSSVNVSGPGISNSSTSGSQYIYPQNSGNYTINAYGYNGTSIVRSIYLSVDGNNNNNYYNNNYNNTPSVSTYSPTNVTSSSAVLPGYVNSNGSTVNSWIEFPCYGARYGNLYNQSSSSISASVSSIAPGTTYTFCAAAEKNGQIYRGNSVSFTTLGNSNIILANSNVVTTIATNITRNSATVNGYITNSSYYNTNTYFEYGTTADLGSRTVSKSANGNSAIADSLSGLNSDTIYFFRAVSEGTNGTSKGTVEIFRTLGDNAGVITRTIYQGTTVIGSESPIMLKIENRYPLIGEGDVVDYTVTYKNIGKLTLVKPVLQVIIPKGITVTNYTSGTFSTDSQTLTVPLEDLVAGQEGTVNVEGKVDSMPKDTAQIVSTAVLVYTNKDGAQENAIAYVLNSPKTLNTSNNGLGALALFGGIFPTTLVGWLILIIVILLIVIIARTFSRRQTVHVQPHTDIH